MRSVIVEHVLSRLRQQLPADGHVVAGSTPVLSFGNAAEAVVATIGLNPSRQEFLDRNGRELSGRSRRFETLKSLGVPELASASDSDLLRVVGACNTYFAANPYRRWFDQLEPILRSVGASYYDGSACHLDLVQWATDPVWSKIPDRTVRDRLLEQDSVFFRHQLRHGAFRLVLLNGNSVIKQFESVMKISLRPKACVSGVSKSSRLLVGNLPWRTQVVAWSINVQSSWGVCKVLRDRLAEQVAECTSSSLTS